MIVFKVGKEEMQHITIFRACLNFMNCTDFFCRCFIHTGSISMTGVRLVPFMEPPEDCLWGGGRVEAGEAEPEEVLALIQKYGISARLTFSNSLLRKEHLADQRCNMFCQLFEKSTGVKNGVIVHSELLVDYLKKKYPGFYLVSSTTKVLTEFQECLREIQREDFQYVVPDFRLNKMLDKWNTLSEGQKDKVEFLCNECCWFGCRDRKACYEDVSRKNLGEDGEEHRCTAPKCKGRLSFFKSNDKSGIYQRRRYQKYLFADGIYKF